MSYYDEPGAPQEYSATAGFGAVGPGIDISHYGAPYQGMLGLGSVGMLYRYGAGLGQATWSPAPGQSPSEDPRMVAQFTTVRSTYRATGLSATGTPRDAVAAGTAILAKGRAQFAGNSVRPIGTNGWTADGRVGYDVILAAPTRSGEIKLKNRNAGNEAAAAMGGGVRFTDARTAIPANAFTGAPPGTPAVPEEAASAAPGEEGGSFLTQRVAGLPVWAVGLIGITVVGGIGAVVMMSGKKKPAAVAANRRRRKSSRRSSRNPRAKYQWGGTPGPGKSMWVWDWVDGGYHAGWAASKAEATRLARWMGKGTRTDRGTLVPTRVRRAKPGELARLDSQYR